MNEQPSRAMLRMKVGFIKKLPWIPSVLTLSKLQRLKHSCEELLYIIYRCLYPRVFAFFLYFVYITCNISCEKKLQYSIAFLKVAPSLVNEQRPQRYRYIGASFIFSRLRLTTRLRSVAYHVMQSSWRQPHQSTAAAAASEVDACSVCAPYTTRVLHP